MEFAEDDLPLPSFADLFTDVNPKGNRKMPSQECPIDNGTTGRWSEQEHWQFLEGIKMYGKDFKKIKTLIQTRNVTQIRTHAQKVFKSIYPKDLTEDSWDIAISSLIEKELELREGNPYEVLQELEEIGVVETLP